MSLMLKPGTRLFSVVCATELIVVKAPGEPAAVTIGGVVPVFSAAERPTGGSVADGHVVSHVVDGHGGGAAMGKRYVDAEGVIELLCTKPGEGVPALGGVLLQFKDAKPMPASD